MPSEASASSQVRSRLCLFTQVPFSPCPSPGFSPEALSPPGVMSQPLARQQIPRAHDHLTTPGFLPPLASLAPFRHLPSSLVFLVQGLGWQQTPQTQGQPRRGYLGIVPDQRSGLLWGGASGLASTLWPLLPATALTPPSLEASSLLVLPSGGPWAQYHCTWGRP